MDILSKQIIELARSAPSLHNTQPWYFVLEKQGFSLYVDRLYVLANGDAIGRELWLSMGAMVECVIQSAAALGIGLTYTAAPDLTFDKPVAYFSHLKVNSPPDQALLKAIAERRSYRGRMLEAPLSSQQQHALKKMCASISSAHIHLVLDPKIRQLVADLTKRGMEMALNDEHFSGELSRFVLPNWSKERRGMHGRVLGKSGALSSWWESFSIRRRIGVSKKARNDQSGLLGSNGLVLITSPGDTPPFWLQSGRLYYRVALALQAMGYASSTTAATVEAGSFHEEVESQIGTKERLQAVLRFGKAPDDLPAKTARLSLEQLIRSK